MKSTTKLIKIAIVLMLILLVLLGCERGSYKIHRGELIHKENKYIGEYKSFDGHIEYYLGELQEVNLIYSVSTKSGEFRICVLNEKREVIKSINGKIDGNIKEIFRNKQNIWLKLEGNNHEGSYLIELLR